MPPVFDVDEKLFLDIFPPEDYTGRREYWAAGGLYRLYSQLFPKTPTQNIHIKRAENLIRTTYMEPITVEDIARGMNLDRRYLSRIFKTYTGKTVQQYLIAVRMEAAAAYMAQGYSVQEAARLCGYRDPTNFSKMFKKHFQSSPRKFINPTDF